MVDVDCLELYGFLKCNLSFIASLTEDDKIDVEYLTLPGWKGPIAGVRNFQDLPQEAQDYVKKIEELMEVKSKIFVALFMLCMFI